MGYIMPGVLARVVEGPAEITDAGKMRHGYGMTLLVRGERVRVIIGEEDMFETRVYNTHHISDERNYHLFNPATNRTP